MDTMDKDTTLRPSGRVVLLDDATLARTRLLHVLLTHIGVQIGAEASDPVEPVHLRQTHRPDIVLINRALPAPQPQEVVACLRKAFPQLGVVIVATQPHENPATRTASAGTVVYVLHEAAFSDLDDLAQVIHTIVHGPHTSGAEAVVEKPWQRLTPRQRDIVRLIVQGFTTKEIAQRLQRSVKTIESHRRQVMQRLGVRNVAELVRSAMQQHLHTHTE